MKKDSHSSLWKKCHLFPSWFFFFFFALFLTLSANAQTNSQTTIKGSVTDSNGESIIGATVVAVDNKKVGTITDAFGNFQIKFSSTTKALQINYLGYALQEIELKGQTYIKVVLEVDSKMLTDVVVVGYGSQKKESVIGAISTVSSKDILRSPVGNISNALVGRASGLTAIQKSGEPGLDQATIRIRGIGTFSGDQNPLVVIDGIVQSLETMNSLDANEIDNINLLKDASATAVYGVRGANGVIIITTKKGVAGTPQMSFTANYGFNNPSSMAKLTNSYDYAVLRNEALRNNGLNQPDKILSDDELWKFANNRDYTSKEIAAMTFLTEEQRVALSNSPAVYYGSHDYLNEIFNQTAPQQQYNLNLSGGSEKVKYFVSLGYLNQEGMLNNFGMKDTPADTRNQRISFRNNFDFNFVKNLEFNVSVSGQFGNFRTFAPESGNLDTGGRYRDIVVNIYEAPPFIGPGVLDGKLVAGYAGLKPDNNAMGVSPVGALLKGKNIGNLNRNNINISTRLKHTMDYLIKGLSIRGAFSYENNFSKTTSITSNLPTYLFTRNPENPNEFLFFGGELNSRTVSEKSFSKNYKVYVEGGIDYQRKIDKHAVTALALVTAERRTMAGLLYNVPQGMYGVVGRVTYAYDDKYLSEINMGYNGSENFAPARRFGLFPAVSLGWIASNESFFPKNDYVTWVKIRGSYGQTGNSNIGGRRFMYLPGTWGAYSSYSSPLQGYYFGYTDGTYLSTKFPGKYEQSVGNPDVTWEKKESSNIALDVNFFKDRMSLSMDLFKEVRNNILTTLATIPGIIGLDNGVLPPMNVGSMENKGFEVNLKWRDRVKDFTYEIGGQVSYAKNKILEKAEPPYPYNWMNETGFSYGQYKGYLNDGFYNTAQEAANHPFNTTAGNNAQAGDLRITDINGDGIINEKDKVPIGYSNVPRFAFSSSLFLGYKGFEISALFTGTAQGSFLMEGYLINPFTTGSGNAMQYMFDERWTKEKYATGQSITYPRVSANTINGTQNGLGNSFWIRSTDHIKLKNVEIAYSFTKQRWLAKVHLSSLRLYANANNLITWKRKELIDAIDPELVQDQYTSEGAIYPIAKTVNVGFKIQF